MHANNYTSGHTHTHTEMDRELFYLVKMPAGSSIADSLALGAWHWAQQPACSRQLINLCVNLTTSAPTFLCMCALVCVSSGLCECASLPINTVGFAARTLVVNQSASVSLCSLTSHLLAVSVESVLLVAWPAAHCNVFTRYSLFVSCVTLLCYPDRFIRLNCPVN